MTEEEALLEEIMNSVPLEDLWPKKANHLLSECNFITEFSLPSKYIDKFEKEHPEITKAFHDLYKVAEKGK